MLLRFMSATSPFFIASLFICLAYESNGNPSPDFDVIVVGAGISGLTAAYELKKKNPDIRLIVLEASDRVGGRTLSVDMRGINHTIDRFDLGGQWIHSLQLEIIDLLSELGVATFPQHVIGSRLYQTPPSNEITIDHSAPGAFSEVELDGFRQVQEWLDDINFEQGLTGDQRYEYWNRTTVAEALGSFNLPQEAVSAINGLISFHFGASSEDISMLYFLMTVKSTGTLLYAMQTAVANGRRIVGGSQTLAEKLAIGIDVRRGQEVVRVATESNSANVTTRNNATFTSKVIIMAIPPVIASEIVFTPPLPNEKMTLLRNLRPVGDYFKFVATYEFAFWRGDNLTGNVHFRAGDSVHGEAANGSIKEVVTFDSSTASGSPALVGYYVPSRTEQSESEWKREVLDIITRLFDLELARFPVDYREMRWYPRVPYCRGGVGILGVGQVPQDYTTILRSPTHKRIFWAGTETATEWMSYMNGAVQAGQRVAAEVLKRSQRDLSVTGPISALTHFACSLYGAFC